MGIALFTLSSLLTPLQELVTRLVPFNPRPAAKTPPRAVCGPGSTPCTVRMPLKKNSSAQPRRALPLRVVRSIDSEMPVGSTGRMMISGRMADVCAELDRLAAMEARM
jgi:hypothetical protein